MNKHYEEMIKDEEFNEEMSDDFEVVEEVKESKLKGFINMAGAGIKKHGKKVAGVAALIAIGAIGGYAMGHKSGEHGDSDYSLDDAYEPSLEECDFSESSVDLPESTEE